MFMSQKPVEHTTEFGRFALNSKAIPEKFEEWANAMYGIAPRTSAKTRRKRR